MKGGLPMYVACSKARVPQRTVYELMKREEWFMQRIQAYKNYLPALVHNIHLSEVEKIRKKVDNGEELTKEDKAYLMWFSQNAWAVKGLYNPNSKVYDKLEETGAEELDKSEVKTLEDILLTIELVKRKQLVEGEILPDDNNK